MFIRYLRRGLRLLTMLAILISVLVACNTGDSPLTVQPLSPDPTLQSSTQDSDPLLALLPQSLQGSTSISASEPKSQLLTSSVLTGLKRPYGLIWDGSHFVLSEFGFSLGSSGLRIVPTDGSPPTFLGAGQLGRLRDVDLEGDHFLALDGGYGYPGQLFQIPRSGGEPTVIASGLGAAVSLTPISSGVYVITNVEGQLLRVDHGQVSQIADGLGVLYGVAVVDPQTYLVTDLVGARILRVTAGGEVTPLVTTGLEMPRDIQRESSGAYLVVDMGLAPGQGRLLRMFESGELEVIEEQGLGNPTGVVEIEPGVFGVTDYVGNRLLRIEEEDSDPVQPGTVVIQNAEEIDGQPLQVGETIILQALAMDATGVDVSDQIEWFDQADELIGKGQSISYQATQVRTETIAARLSAASDHVSFTVSSQGVTMAPHVKGLVDQAKDSILDLDWENQILELRKDSILPNIAIGDVIVGAGFMIPPTKITSLEDTGETVIMGIEQAHPKDVFIETPVFDTWELARFDDQGNPISLATISQKSISLVEETKCQIPIPKWEDKFQMGELPIDEVSTVIPEELLWDGLQDTRVEIGGSASLSAGGSLEMCLNINPLLSINENSDLYEGISYFGVEIEATQINARVYAELEAKGYLTADAKSVDLPLFERFPLPTAVTGLVFVVPAPGDLPGNIDIPIVPISLWVYVTGYHHVDFSPLVEIGGSFKGGYQINNGRVAIKVEYPDADGSWGISPDVESDLAEKIEPLKEIQGFARGNIKVAWNPEIELALWGGTPAKVQFVKGGPIIITPPTPAPPPSMLPFVFPRVGIKPFSEFNFGIKSPVVPVVNPENPYQAREDITLAAGNSSKGRLIAGTGLGATLGKRVGSNNCSDIYNYDGIPQPLPGIKPTISPNRLGDQCYSHRENQYRRRCYSNLSKYQSHHIVQNATLKQGPFLALHPGYGNGDEATAVLMDRDTHQATKNAQNKTILTKGMQQGNLFTELAVAEDALVSANAAGKMQVDIEKQIQCTLDYMNTIPGVSSSDPTYKPRKRP